MPRSAIRRASLIEITDLAAVANAERALKLAIAVGGDKVKARAEKDADFTKVRGAKWFQTLTLNH
jgi:hypothetical protein